MTDLHANPNAPLAHQGQSRQPPRNGFFRVADTVQGARPVTSANMTTTVGAIGLFAGVASHLAGVAAAWLLAIWTFGLSIAWKIIQGSQEVTPHASPRALRRAAHPQ